MKKVILIGDSIRFGYDKFIKESLSGVAEVYYPDENCKFAEYVLRYLHEWKETLNWPTNVDVVHWNVGLWDCLRILGDSPLTPKQTYYEYIKRIDKRIRQLFPNAKIIFATCTSVIEEGYSKDFYRINKEIEEYNKLAIEALSDTDTLINDLYQVSKKCSPEWRSDMTHYYTEEGTKLIGGQVLKAIKDAIFLSIDKVKDVKVDFNELDKKTIGF